MLITTAAYADTQLLWLRPPVSGAQDLAAALAAPKAGGFAVEMLTDGTNPVTKSTPAGAPARHRVHAPLWQA